MFPQGIAHWIAHFQETDTVCVFKEVECKDLSLPSPNALLEAAHHSLLSAHSVGLGFSFSLREICPHLVVILTLSEPNL